MSVVRATDKLHAFPNSCKKKKKKKNPIIFSSEPLSSPILRIIF